MANDNEVQVDAQEDSEDTQAEDTTTTPDSKEEKPKETLEQKKARLERQLKKVRKDLGEDEDSPSKNEPKKEPTDLDYGQKAFLKASGISGADEIALVKEFAKRTGEPIDVVIDDEIFKGRLERLRTTKANELAAAAGKRGNQASANSVEAILAKLGPNDPIPADLPRDVREKVVAARRSKSGSGRMFYND